MRAGLASLVLGAALLLGADMAHADEAAGREHFRKGVDLYNKGAFPAALVEFNAAYAAAPSWRILFNVGQTCAELKDNACAMNAFDKYLADGGKSVPADKRATAQAEKKRLKELVSYLFITVNVDGADVTVDDVRVGSSKLAEPVLVSAGHHTVAASKGSLFPARRAVDVPGGSDHIEVQLDLVEPPAPPQQKVLFVTRPEKQEKSRLPFWIGLGATGVLAATTTTFGILTLGAKSSLESQRDTFGVTRAEIADLQSKQDTLAIVTDVALGVTILAAGITTVVLLLRR